MSNTQHTPGPWSVGGTRHFKHSGGIDGVEVAIHYGPAETRGNCIAHCYGHGASGDAEEDARRIVACMNRLQNFTTDQIEDFGYDLAGISSLQNQLWKSQHQRNELLEALKEVLDCDNTRTSFGAVMRARAAIVKATGEQA